jgi:choline dehydrogenase-like flavoprotein
MGIQELGIPINEDLNSGYATGANLIPSSITAKNQPRADARTAYWDPVRLRPNLELLTGHTVTRILNGAARNKTSRNLAGRAGDVPRKVTITKVEVK